MSQLLIDLLETFVHGPPNLNLKFEQQRQEWLENVTREQLLADMTRIFTTNYPRISRWAVFTPEEVKNVREIFEKHAEKDPSNNTTYWTQQTFTSHLTTHLPPTSIPTFHLCSRTIYKSLLHLSYHPFPPPNTNLTSDGLVRALAFLSGRDDLVFSFAGGTVGSKPMGRSRDEVISHETLFKSLAERKEGVEVELERPDGGVLDMLVETQPLLHEKTAHFALEELFDTANRLSSGSIPVSDFRVKEENLNQLLAFLRELVDAQCGENLVGFEELREDLDDFISYMREHIEEDLEYWEIEMAGSQAFASIRKGLFVVVCRALLGREPRHRELQGKY